nr:SRPBCC domain-containing protein [Salaquimonas pukyongi]
MGGEYVTDWKVGSPLSFKKPDGAEVIAGTLLKFEPEKLLQHIVRNAMRSIDATLTYEFSEQNGVTTLKGSEEFTEPISDEEYADSLAGWDAALNMVKEIAEKQ